MPALSGSRWCQLLRGWPACSARCHALQPLFVAEPAYGASSAFAFLGITTSVRKRCRLERPTYRTLIAPMKSRLSFASYIRLSGTAIARSPALHGLCPGGGAGGRRDRYHAAEVPPGPWSSVRRSTAAWKSSCRPADHPQWGRRQRDPPIWPIVRCFCSLSRSLKNSGARKRNDGLHSMPNRGNCLVCCWMRWPGASNARLKRSCLSCRAWPISRCGRQPARPPSGRTGRSWSLIAATAMKRA